MRLIFLYHLLLKSPFNGVKRLSLLKREIVYSLNVPVVSALTHSRTSEIKKLFWDLSQAIGASPPPALGHLPCCVTFSCHCVTSSTLCHLLSSLCHLLCCVTSSRGFARGEKLRGTLESVPLETWAGTDRGPCDVEPDAQVSRTSEGARDRVCFFLSVGCTFLTSPKFT